MKPIGKLVAKSKILTELNKEEVITKTDDAITTGKTPAVFTLNGINILSSDKEIVFVNC